MDAMPVKRLIPNELVHDGEMCALGVLGQARGLDLSKQDPHDIESVANKFDVAACLAREIVYMNDESCYRPETPEERWTRMRKWVEAQITRTGTERETGKNSEAVVNTIAAKSEKHQ